jgi:hypothetical protein
MRVNAVARSAGLTFLFQALALGAGWQSQLPTIQNSCAVQQRGIAASMKEHGFFEPTVL